MTKGATWTAWLSAWEQYQRAAGVPATTIGLRLYHVARVGREVGGTPASTTAEQLIEWLAAQSWSPNTRRSWRTSLRAFYSWAMITGRVRLSPAHQLPPVRVPRGKPKPAPESTYRATLAMLATSDRRVWLAVRLAGACGLRRTEVAQVQREDLEPDLAGWSLRVVGKGGHVRMVPLPDDLAAALLALPSGWVFPSSHGGHLTPHHLAKLVSRALGPGLTMHMLRHRCGTVSYRATKDLRAVQELLGHAKPETTALYTEVEGEAVRKAMAAAAA